MARLARVIVPDMPYHVTQRGNGRERTFFSDDDFALYRDLLGEACRDAKVGVWAWCLMPNHVHLILTPSDGDGLRRALARVHRRVAGIVNARRRRTGHFWQGRFGAVAMGADHLAAAFRSVSLNPRAWLPGRKILATSGKSIRNNTRTPNCRRETSRFSGPRMVGRVLMSRAL